MVGIAWGAMFLLLTGLDRFVQVFQLSKESKNHLILVRRFLEVYWFEDLRRHSLGRKAPIRLKKLDQCHENLPWLVLG